MCDFSLTKYLEKQMKWSEIVFGKRHTSKSESLLKHIERELQEIREDPDDPMEWIDVIMLAFDGLRGFNLKPQEICDLLYAKQRINFKRKWGKPDKDGVIEHIDDTK